MIVGLIENVPKLKYSHNRGYAQIWADLLRESIQYAMPTTGNGEKLYLYMGINYSGTLNLFGGASKDLYDRLVAFMNYAGPIFVLDHDMPDLGKLLVKRIGNKTTYEGFTEDFMDKLTFKCSEIQKVTMYDKVKDELVIGDSHSLSMTPSETPVIRCDAKTLNGICSDHDFILSKIPEGLKKLTLQFGSIDVRHHLMRFGGKSGAKELLNRYYELVKKIQALGIEVTICQPVPIETEDRKMAATTMYKKKPFSGTRNERLALTGYMIDHMRTNAPCQVIGYPDEWYSMPPEQFEGEIMERPRGIHIGPPNYVSVQQQEITLEEYFT
jgi:hypothetical protein